MTASRLQRWAIILSAYDYEVKYQPSSQHGNADGLSRLPLQEVQHTQDVEAEFFCALEEQQFQALPIRETDIKAATARDPVLSQVYSFCARGWPTTSHFLDKKVIPFFNKHLQLTTCNAGLSTLGPLSGNSFTISEVDLRIVT